MSEAIVASLILYTPLALVCIIIYALGSAAQNPSVARALRVSSVTWFIGLGALYFAFILALGTCGGNMIYGYNNCTVMPVHIANLSLGAFLLGTASGILYGVLLLIGAAGFEWRHRRRTRDTVA